MEKTKNEQRQEELNKGCGKYLGYTHLSGDKAVCGDDIVTRIIYCEKCRRMLQKLGVKG